MEIDENYDEMKQDARTCLSLMSQGLLYPEHIPMVLAALEEVICTHTHVHTSPASCQRSKSKATQGVVGLETICAISICLFCVARNISAGGLLYVLCATHELSEYLTTVSACHI